MSADSDTPVDVYIAAYADADAAKVDWDAAYAHPDAAKADWDDISLVLASDFPRPVGRLGLLPSRTPHETRLSPTSVVLARSRTTLDEVVIRVPGSKLAVCAVAARQDFLDPLQLALRSELACLRLDRVKRASDELGDGYPLARAGREVHHGRLEPVPRGEELVFDCQDAVVARKRASRLEPLAVVLDEGLEVRGYGDGVVDVRDGIADPQLDRAEPRVDADVPPDARVVGDAACALKLADHLGVFGVAPKAGRHARAGECREHHLT